MNTEKNILLIDDDSRNIFALSAVLRARGYSVIAANSMEEAFAILDDTKNIGIILMDMMMPGMDGYEAIPKIKSDVRYGYLPLISVTAQAMAGDREKSLAAGADEYVSKPVDIDLLSEIIKKHLK